MNPFRRLAPLVLAIASGACFAAAPELHVSKHVEIDAPAAAVWDRIKGFDSWNTWHPAVARDEIVEGRSNVPGAVRVLTLGDGGTIREKLLEFDDGNRTLRYEILESVLPVSHYRSTLGVKSAGKGTSIVTWSGDFKRKDTGDHPGEKENDETATTTMSGVYQGGLDNLKKLVEGK